MNQTKADGRLTPVDQPLDPEVISFRAQFDERSPLDELVREGARRMLQSAINAEVDAFIELHDHRRDEEGRRLVVKNGRLPERELLTGAGRIPLQQGRVRDNTQDAEKRVTFTPSILPAYLRKTEGIEELIPWLYLKGISTGDFAEALQSLVGERAAGLTPTWWFALKNNGVWNTSIGASETLQENITFTSGPMASTPRCVWKMTPIKSSVYW